MTDSSISVLMSVYKNDRAEHLDRALGSLVEQTLRPAEIVLVEDGPLTPELEAVIRRRSAEIAIRPLVLAKNVGLGRALAAGLLQCRHELVARMDSDDISAPERLAKQAAYLLAHPEIAVVGTWISEFDGAETDIYAYRKLPTEPDELRRFAKTRMPVNHVSVLFRKSAILASGSYSTMRGLEDYPLWGRMLVKGYKFANIPEVLVNVRAGREMIDRRGGLKYLVNELAMLREFRRIGLINPMEFMVNLVVRIGLRLVPNRLRRFIYMKAFRRQ
ncbi:MAG: glycosyltransferase [Candidatus Saganbacteria bacterium]|nr:glycosyltransferase [Candidatus Saganbacteria bacterium]